MTAIASPAPSYPPLVRAAPDSLSGARNRPARILIVEDDFLIALEMEHHLIHAGFEVVGIAGTAEDALDLAASEKPQVAIMDIRLAGIRDGVDAAIELAEKFGVRSIFATAHSDEATRKRAEQAQPLGWLQKPYPPKMLIELVRSGLAR